MDEQPKLTDRQQQILDLVQSAIERTGAPPTRAEIAAELGFARRTPPRNTCRRWPARASSSSSAAPRAASACSLTRCAR